MKSKLTQQKIWRHPWGRMLSDIPWSGCGYSPSSPRLADSLYDLDILQLPEQPALLLPANPMNMAFSKLLQAIPWSGSKARITQNRLAEVFT